LFICAKDLFVEAKEETPATRGYVLAGARSLCVVERSHIVGRSDQVVALIPWWVLFIHAKELFVAANGNANDRRTKSAANEINQN
jgi:hypothetical protein